MSRKPSEPSPPGERELSRWRLVADFQDRLAQAVKTQPLAATWSEPQRELHCADYLSLFLFGLLNPVVRTLRGLCAASHLRRVQQEVCSRPVSLGSFSEAQAVVDPALLGQVFAQLSREVAGPKPAAGTRNWLIQDSSLFEALPRMHWALWRRQGIAQNQVRLHLALDAGKDSPAQAQITLGTHCERKAWRTQWERGDAYVGDRYYGGDYQLFEELETAGVAFVVRLRETAVLEVLEELPLTAADRQAHVLRQARVRLGCKARYHSIPLRVVWVQTPKEVLLLVTSLSAADLAAADVALLYKQRWQVEVFFRWLKCILDCRHWLAESPEGTTIQLYLALIGALLLQRYTGQRPTKRMLELIQFYLVGMADLAEVWQGLERERTRRAKKI